ncbi:MAG: PH domain-containing protein [Mycobacteriaceae bacterium]|nr:PH domain-containing protein [Mycobacteriaceae bacterium]
MQQTSWAPSATAVVGSGILGALMAFAAVMLVTDAPGRILVGVSGLGLLIFAGFSLRARPRLAITPQGLLIRGWWRTMVLPRPAIRLIRITEFRRLARKVRLLEIDTADDRLIVFSRWDLGTNPIDVLDALTDAGYSRRPGPPTATP